MLIARRLGLIALLFSCWIWRQWLNARRRHGEASYRVVLVGSRAAVRAIALNLACVPSAGYLVVAVIIPGTSGRSADLGDSQLSASGDIDEVQNVIVSA